MFALWGLALSWTKIPPFKDLAELLSEARLSVHARVHPNLGFEKMIAASMLINCRLSLFFASTVLNVCSIVLRAI